LTIIELSYRIVIATILIYRIIWGTGRGATLLKTLLQYFGKSLEALPGVAYHGFRDNRSTLNTKTGLKKSAACCSYTVLFVPMSYLLSTNVSPQLLPV